jgi:hypothetical protein
MEGGTVGHNIERGPPKDHPSQICFNLVQRFQRRRFKCDQIENQVSDYRLLGASSFLLVFEWWYLSFYKMIHVKCYGEFLMLFEFKYYLNVIICTFAVWSADFYRNGINWCWMTAFSVNDFFVFIYIYMLQYTYSIFSRDTLNSSTWVLNSFCVWDSEFSLHLAVGLYNICLIINGEILTSSEVSLQFH